MWLCHAPEVQQHSASNIAMESITQQNNLQFLHTTVTNVYIIYMSVGWPVYYIFCALFQQRYVLYIPQS